MFSSLWKFISYWYFRYLLVSELYMVEKWEEIMIYIVFIIAFTLLSIFNNTIVLGLVDSKQDLFLYPFTMAKQLIT